MNVYVGHFLGRVRFVMSMACLISGAITLVVNYAGVSNTSAVYTVSSFPYWLLLYILGGATHFLWIVDPDDFLGMYTINLYLLLIVVVLFALAYVFADFTFGLNVNRFDWALWKICFYYAWPVAIAFDTLVFPFAWIVQHVKVKVEIN